MLKLRAKRMLLSEKARKKRRSLKQLREQIQTRLYAHFRRKKQKLKKKAH